MSKFGPVTGRHDNKHAKKPRGEILTRPQPRLSNTLNHESRTCPIVETTMRQYSMCCLSQEEVKGAHSVSSDLASAFLISSVNSVMEIFPAVRLAPQYIIPLVCIYLPQENHDQDI